MSPVELPESLLDFCVRSIRLMLFSVCVKLPKPTLGVPWNPDCCCCCCCCCCDVDDEVLVVAFDEDGSAADDVVVAVEDVDSR